MHISELYSSLTVDPQSHNRKSSLAVENWNLKNTNRCHSGGMFNLYYVVAQLVEALRYMPEGRGFDSGRIMDSNGNEYQCISWE